MSKSKAFLKVGVLVAVHWIDIFSAGSWHSLKAIEEMEPLCCTTVGFVVEHREDVLKIVGTLGEMADPNAPLINDSTIFPMKAIRKIVVLERTNKVHRGGA